MFRPSETNRADKVAQHPETPSIAQQLSLRGRPMQMPNRIPNEFTVLQEFRSLGLTEAMPHTQYAFG